MMVTMLVSAQLFGVAVTPQLVIAVVLVATSTLQYNLSKAALLGEWGENEEESKLIRMTTTPGSSSSGPDDEAEGFECEPVTPPKSRQGIRPR